MKKLLIALTVASLAALSQAVTLTWSYGATDTWSTSVTTGVLVYAASEMTIDAALTAARTGTDAVVSKSDAGFWTMEADNIADQYNWAVLEDGVDAQENGTYFIVLFGEGGAATGNYAIASLDATKIAETAWSQSVAPNPALTTPVSGLTFTGTLVPEPTVLALLALGVAGLALRRKA